MKTFSAIIFPLFLISISVACGIQLNPPQAQNSQMWIDQTSIYESSFLKYLPENKAVHETARWFWRVRWFHKIETSTDPKVQTFNGRQYLLGKTGTEMTLRARMARAFKLFHKAAVQGYAKAECDLGWLYANGDLGVPHDEVEGLAWLNLGVTPENEFAIRYRDYLENTLDPKKVAKAKQRSKELLKEIEATKKVKSANP